MPGKKRDPLKRTEEEMAGKRPKSSLEDILRDLQAGAPPDDDLDDEDEIDRLLGGEIQKARRGQATYDPGDALEAVAALTSDETLADASRKPVSYALQSEDAALMAPAVGDDLLDPARDVDVYIREPTDFSKAKVPAVPEEVWRERQRQGLAASFQWSDQKTYAAGFAALMISPRKIAALVGASEEEVASWFANVFFRRRVQRIRDNSGRLAYEFASAHQLLLWRHLIAIALSGSKENDTQLKAIKVALDKLEFSASKFLGNEDVEKNPQLAGIMNVLEAEAKLLDDSISVEEEWAEREIGPEFVAATADAKRAIEADNAKLLARPVKDVDQVAEEALAHAFSAAAETVDPQAPAPSAAELLDALLEALPEPEGGTRARTLDYEDLVRPSDVSGLDGVDPDREVAFVDLVRLRLEASDRDDMLASFFAEQMRGKRWMPILTLDPEHKQRLQQTRKRLYRRSRARDAAPAS